MSANDCQRCQMQGRKKCQCVDPEEFWPDRPDHSDINEAMSVARDAFNAAYFESETTADLATNVQATTGALATVLQLIAPEDPS